MPIVSPVPAEPGVEIHFFWDKHRAEIVAAILVVLLVLSGYTTYRFVAERRATEASAELSSAKSAPDYQHVIDKYPGTPAAANACLLLAEAFRSEKKYNEANAALKSLTEKFPKHQFVSTAWMAIAANLESAGKTDEALATYQQTATRYPQSFNAPLAMISQVPILKSKNRPDEARRVCENIMTQFRESLVTAEAQRQLKLLRKSSDAIAPAAVAPGVAVSPAPEVSASPAAAGSANP